jgi:hypothetical protein
MGEAPVELAAKVLNPVELPAPVPPEDGDIPTPLVEPGWEVPCSIAIVGKTGAPDALARLSAK